MRALARFARRLWPSLADRVIRLVRRIRGRPGRRDPTVIGVGVGRGLRFDAGSSNPEYASGRNELPVQEALAEHLKPGDVLYDIGANVGFFTVLGARVVGPAGRVYAFEPVRENADYVRYNARLNDFAHVVVVERGVARASGHADLVLARYSGGSALASVAPPPDAAGRVTIEVVAIDDFVAQAGVRAPSVVKLDVEGAEREVLEGMTSTLVRYRPVIVFEIDDARRDAFDRKRVACEELLRGFGYEVRPLEDSYPTITWIVGHYLATPKTPPRPGLGVGAQSP